MTQYEFDKILQQYLDGKCTPEEEKVVQEWYSRIEQKKNEALSVSNQAAIGERIWRKIRMSADLKKSWLSITWVRYGVVAASIALFLWIGWQLNVEQKATETTEFAQLKPEDIEIKNNSAKPQEINLEDGSLVVLEPQSALSYAENFGKDTRTVHLQGDAFFQIKKDPSKPFQVLSGKLVTEVLGTSFFIKQGKASGTVEVEVRSGKVSVYEKTEKEKGNKKVKILTQNQKVTFRPDTKQLIPSIVSQPLTAQQKPAAEPCVELNFEDAALPDVFKRLEQLYFLDIITDNEALNECVFTGDLNGLPLFLQIELVCKTIGAHYEVKETSIMVQGVGCKNRE